MRESLTIFAIAIILLLSALLVGPYLVDWNGQRDWLAARLSTAFGAQVKIGGPIEVRLLPTPIFRAGHISMDGATAQDPHLRADHLDTELSINGLLRGAVEFVDVRIASPRLEVTMRADGSLVADVDVANPQQFQFTHAIISNGTIAIRDEAGADRLVIDGIAAQGEAETLFGPVKLSGTAKGQNGPVRFRLNTSAYGARKVRARLVVDQQGPIAHLDADGQINLQPASGPGRAALSFDGSLNLAGSLQIAEATSPIPWTLSAPLLKADAKEVATSAFELRAGAEGRATVANGAGSLTLGKAPVGVVQLKARQLDLDRITVPPDVAPDTPRPRAAQWAAALQSLLGETPLPFRLTVNAAADAVTTRGLTFTDAAVGFDTGPGASRRGTASISGPNGSRLALDGTLENGPAAAFKGRIDAATRDLATASGWVDPFWPGVADWVARNVPVQDVSARGLIDVSRVGVSARDMTIDMDGTTLRGVFSVTAGVGTERPRVFADVVADRVETDRLPSLANVIALMKPADLAVTVASDAVRLSGGAGATSDTGHLRFRLTKRGSDTTIDQFSISNVAGATATGTAALDGSGRFRTDGHVNAPDVAPLLSLFRDAMPTSLAERLVDRAKALSPLGVDLSVDGTVGESGDVTLVRLTGSGAAKAIRFSAAVSPVSGASGDKPMLDGRAMLDVTDAAAALREWGLVTATVPLGTGHAEATARGRPESGFETRASMTVAGATAAFVGRVDSLSVARGRLTASGLDAGPLLGMAGLPASSAPSPFSATADLKIDEGTLSFQSLQARVAGVSASGSAAYGAPSDAGDAALPVLTGTLAVDTAALSDLTGLALGPVLHASGAGWSKDPFGQPPTWPRSEIALRFGTLTALPNLVAREVRTTLKLGPGSLTLADLSGKMLDGTVAGTATLRRDGTAASLSGQIKVDGLTLALPSLTGRLSSTMNLASTGGSRDGLIGSLAGEGSFTLKSARMPRLDPSALLKTAAFFDVEGATVDGAAIRDTLLLALDKKPIDLGDLSAPATLAAGTLRLVGLGTKAETFEATTDVTVDLRNSALTARTALSSVERPKDWKGDPPQVAVTWSGPIFTPTREIDASAFANGLAARAIARDQERIELMQDDVRERAFFARRLKTIEAEQQAARDAAQILKMVPQPPRPGAIRTPKLPESIPPIVDQPIQVKTDPPAGITDFIQNMLKSDTKKAAPAQPLDLGPPPQPPAIPGTSGPAASAPTP